MHDSTLLEVDTRKEIDEKLVAAGWAIQDKNKINLFEKLGVAVREMDTDTGPADYMLFIAGKACGIIEAKREGASLGHVAEQSARYATSQTKHIQRWAADDQPLPFLFEATNHVIRFRDERDPAPRSRNVFHFHKPETLYEEIAARDKTNLDIFWLKDDSLEDTENLPAPDILAAEIVEQLEAALMEFRTVEEVLAAN